MNLATISAAALLVVALALPVDSSAQVPISGTGEGRQFALLIGVEKYEKVGQLTFTLNDVKTIAKTLRERNGVAAGDILTITDDAENPRRRPTRAAMIEEIPRWLDRIGPKDRLIVYFSGHGFRDPAGNLYLAPIDIDKAEPAKTGLSVEWFRKQIADCKADFKLLVLDACHAGTENAEVKDRDVAADKLVNEFSKLDRVATLASSTGAETSQFWDEKEMSLYTYWFNQALKGHADADGSGSVDINEISDYVYKNVIRTVKSQARGKQTPVRSIRFGLEGTPVVAKLRPVDLKTLLNDVAEQMVQAAEDNSLKKLGVLQFYGRGDLGELVGASYGSLGQFCAGWMEARLIAQKSGGLRIMNGSVLVEALKREKFGINDLSNPVRLKQLAAAMDGLPALAQGVFVSRVGRVLSIHCSLVETGSTEILGSAGGSALLNESEWAMLGHSAALTAEDTRPQRPVLNQVQPDPHAVTIAKLDAKSREPHPLANPNFEFPVRIMVKGKERPGVAKGNVWVVPLHKGEIFEVYVGNKCGKPVCLRLLMDGLNTLPDRDMTQTKGVATYLWGQHVSLDDARHWVLDPADPLLKDFPEKVWRISGFVTETGEKGKIRPFMMGTDEQSLAAKRKFTEEIGLITAAIYDAETKPRPRGIVAWDEVQDPIRDNAKLFPGSPRAIINIRYVDADDPASSESIEAIQGVPAPLAGGPQD